MKTRRKVMTPYEGGGGFYSTVSLRLFTQVQVSQTFYAEPLSDIDLTEFIGSFQGPDLSILESFPVICNRKFIGFMYTPGNNKFHLISLAKVVLRPGDFLIVYHPDL